MKVVVLVSGKVRSGKNTFTDLFIDEINKNFPGIKVSFDFFAKPLKDESKEVFRNLINYLNDVSKRTGVSELYTDDDNWYEDKNEITRILLQTYGTEIFRDKVDNLHWIKKLSERLKASDSEIVLVTDWRFKNEGDYIGAQKDYNVIRLRVNRPELLIPVSDMTQHESELDLDDYENFDVVIKNTSIDSLRNKAREVMFEITDLLSK